jgi:hypothetical protein
MSAQAQAMIQQLQRGEITRLMLGLLLLPPAGVNLEFNYVGEAKAPDGMTADIIEAKGEGFTARLFLDQKTHHLLMSGFKSRQFRGRPGGARAGGAGAGQGTGQGAGQAAGQGTGAGAGASCQPGCWCWPGRPTGSDDSRRTRSECGRPWRAPEVDVRLAFADYKAVNGITLPIGSSALRAHSHRGDHYLKYKINPSLKAESSKEEE